MTSGAGGVKECRLGQALGGSLVPAPGIRARAFGSQLGRGGLQLPLTTFGTAPTKQVLGQWGLGVG